MYVVILKQWTVKKIYAKLNEWISASYQTMTSAANNIQRRKKIETALFFWELKVKCDEPKIMIIVHATLEY